MRKSYGKVKNKRLRNENRRKLSIRKKIIGDAESPRICVTKSNKHLRVQVIDDSAGKTLVSAQTYGKNKVADTGNAEGAKKVGTAVSDLMKKQNLVKAVFDRSGKQYTGVIKTIADTMRENGIQL